MARILLVDDEEPIRRMFGKLLTGEGHVVITAVDGHDGLVKSILSIGQLDLLITDGTMPKLNGADMMHAMEVAGCLPSQVLVISGDQEEVFTKHLWETMPPGAKFYFRFLAKPATINQVLEVVNVMLANKVD